MQPKAAITIGNSFGQNFNTIPPMTLGQFVTDTLPYLFYIALVIMVVYLAWGAYRYLMSGGDPKAVQAARAQLTWAVVGFICITLAYGAFAVFSSLLFNIYG